MNGSWSTPARSGMTLEQLKEHVKGIIMEAKEKERAAYARDDAKNAEYWIGKIVCASSILMHLEGME